MGGGPAGRLQVGTGWIMRIGDAAFFSVQEYSNGMRHYRVLEMPHLCPVALAVRYLLLDYFRR
jgi:hypothetical protein